MTDSSRGCRDLTVINPDDISVAAQAGRPPEETGPEAQDLGARQKADFRVHLIAGYSVSCAFLWAATICCCTFGGTGS